MNLILSVLLLSFLDMLFTHYLFFLDRKKGVLNMKCERNFIARLIMGKNPSPENFVMGYMFPLVVIVMLSRFVPVESVYVWVGLFIMVNIYHFIMIKDYRTNWNNKDYWKLIKLSRKIKIY